VNKEVGYLRTRQIMITAGNFENAFPYTENAWNQLRSTAGNSKKIWKVKKPMDRLLG